MADTVTARFLIESRGTVRDLGAFVVAARFDRGGGIVAFALGDGTLRLGDWTQPGEWRELPVHDGAALALAAHPGGGWVSGGDDGRLRRIGADGAIADIASFGTKWVEQVATAPGDKGGVLACAAGKMVHVFDA